MTTKDGGTVILVTRDGLGSVAPEHAAFGREMFERFLHTLEAQAEKPRAICFYTDGVKLVVEGSPVVPALQLIAGMGVRLVACQTCLDYFGLSEKRVAGDAGGMKDILALLDAAEKVITV